MKQREFILYRSTGGRDSVVRQLFKKIFLNNNFKTKSSSWKSGGCIQKIQDAPLMATLLTQSSCSLPPSLLFSTKCNLVLSQRQILILLPSFTAPRMLTSFVEIVVWSESFVNLAVWYMCSDMVILPHIRVDSNSYRKVPVPTTAALVLWVDVCTKGFPIWEVERTFWNDCPDLSTSVVKC